MKSDDSCRISWKWTARLLGLGLLFAYYLALAKARLVDPDEGYFLYAARLVSEGRVPYRDFFFPQMPLIPYLWGGMHALLGGSLWLSGRVLAAGCAALTAMIFWLLLRRRVNGRLAAGLLFFFYLASDIGLEWSVTVKTFMPSTLFLLAGLWALPAEVNELTASKAGWRLLLAGLLAGCAMLTRLTVLPALAALALGLLLQPKHHWRMLAWWLVGLVPALVCIACFWRLDPHAFVYDNWIYHSLGEPLTPGERWSQNFKVMAEKIYSSPTWFIPLAAAAAQWIRRFRNGDLARLERLSAGFVCSPFVFPLAFAGLCAAAMAPIRTFHQYFALATPLLLLWCAPAVAQWVEFFGKKESRWNRARLVAMMTLVMALTLTEPLNILRHRTLLFGHDNDRQKQEWLSVESCRLGVIRQVNRRADALAPPGSLLATWWPGYALDTRLRLAPGLENHFGQRLAHYAPPELARRLNVMPDADLQAIIRRGEPAIIILGLWAGTENWQGPKRTEVMVRAAGYVPVETVGDTDIYLMP